MAEEDYAHKGDIKTVKLLRELQIVKEGAGEDYIPRSPRVSQGSLMSARLKKNMSPRSFNNASVDNESIQGSVEMK